MNLKKNMPIVLLLCFMLCLPLPAQPTLAYAPIDTARTASLTVSFQPKGTSAANVEFKLYKAASVSENCGFTLSDKFNAHPLSLDGLDSAGWRALAQTVAGYAAADGIAPDAAGRTDSSGKVSFSGLDTGLYLVTGSMFQSGDYVYTPAAFLVCLPNYGEDNAWQYDVTAKVKYSSGHLSEGGGGTSVTRRVLKAWKNDEAASRPKSVSVTLLRDGKAYATVDLNERNNWRYTWGELSEYSEWQVVENDVPENYTAAVSKEGITFLVTNTYGAPGATHKPSDPGSTDKPDSPGKPAGTEKPAGTDKPAGTEKPDSPGKPGGNDGPGSPGSTDKPDGPGSPGGTDKTGGSGSHGDPGGTAAPQNPGIPDDPQNPDRPNIPTVPGEREFPPDGGTPPGVPDRSETPPPPRLPQTGILWWPVPLLAVCGAVIFIMGWVKQRTDDENDEN